MKTLLLGGNGYISSEVYKYLKSYGYDVVAIDSCWHNENLGHNLIFDYKILSKEYYDSFDAIVLLAAHSSVPMCDGNFLSSFNNNTVNFANLLEKLEDQKFIYASTSSVYGYVGGNQADEAFNDYRPNNNYDATKILSDQIAQRSNKNYYGLRFGTVNGSSDIFRTDIMINMMTSTYINESKIKLFAADIHRPVLGLKDLTRAIKAILDGDADSGFYNLASFNSTVSDIGTAVAEHLNCKIDRIEGKTNLQNQALPYSFSVTTEKFRTAFDFEFEENIASICDDIVLSFDAMTHSPRKKYFQYL